MFIHMFICLIIAIAIIIIIISIIVVSPRASFPPRAKGVPRTSRPGDSRRAKPRLCDTRKGC